MQLEGERWHFVVGLRGWWMQLWRQPIVVECLYGLLLVVNFYLGVMHRRCQHHQDVHFLITATTPKHHDVDVTIKIAEIEMMKMHRRLGMKLMK